MRKGAELNDGFVRLRPYRKEDLQDLYLAVRESLPQLNPWLDFATDNYSLEDSKKWLTECPKAWEAGSAYNFAITDAQNGQYLGGCGLNDFNPQHTIANLGYWVRTNQTRRGIATACTRLVSRWGIDKLKLQRITIQIARPNRASQRVAEKAGAVLEGNLRNGMMVRDLMYDKVVYSIIPQDLGEGKSTM
jgi:ribosomal-protein-serine acetyltransferase